MLGGSEDSPGWGSSRLSLGVLPGGHYKVHVPGHCSQGEAQVHFSEVPSESGAHLWSPGSLPVRRPRPREREEGLQEQKVMSRSPGINTPDRAGSMGVASQLCDIGRVTCHLCSQCS